MNCFDVVFTEFGRHPLLPPWPHGGRRECNNCKRSSACHGGRIGCLPNSVNTTSKQIIQITNAILNSLHWTSLAQHLLLKRKTGLRRLRYRDPLSMEWNVVKDTTCRSNHAYTRSNTLPLLYVQCFHCFFTCNLRWD